MLERGFDEEYGRDLFLEFVPSSVRHRSEPFGVPVLSSATVAEVAQALGGPIVEVSYAGPSLLAGVVRALKHADAVAAIALPGTRPGDPAGRGAILQVLEVCSQAGLDRPVVLVSRAPRLDDIDDGGIERMADRVIADVELGFSSVAFRPQDIAVDAAPRVAKVAAQLVDLGIGVEIELDRTSGGGLLMAELDGLGLPVAAVRGSRPGDETCGGVRVIDPTIDTIPADEPSRVVIDGFVLKAVLRGLSEAEASPVLSQASDDVSAAVITAGQFIDELDATSRARVEALAYANTLMACESLGAAGTSAELLDALAQELFR